MDQYTQDPVLSQLLAKFADADCCWFASTRPDGRAHLAPIWHVWCEGSVYVVTGSSSVRAHNIQRNPFVSVSLSDPMNVFVIEGIARFAPERVDTLRHLFQEKYAWDITTDPPYDTIIAVEPVKIMAWGSHGEGRRHF